MASLNLNDLSDADLEKELARRKALAEELPKPLENPDFTALIKTVKEGIEQKIRGEERDDDFEHWVYEAAVEAVYGRYFWQWQTLKAEAAKSPNLVRERERAFVRRNRG